MAPCSPVCYGERMQHWILNLSHGDRDQALALMRAGRWPLGRDERHAAALAAGDGALVHVAQPTCRFVGQVQLAGGFVDEGDGGFSGVALVQVQEWAEPVPLGMAVRRIDPGSTNPYVQANAAGFRSGLVQITPGEWEAVLQLLREARAGLVRCTP